MSQVNPKPDIKIRSALIEDCPSLIRLKGELSVHSKMGNKPMLSCQDLERDGFGTDPPYFQCLVAEAESNDQGIEVVGFALYFYGYAAWEGKVLHLEDFCVSKELRGGGIGSALLKELAKIAVKENCGRIQLEVLDWNETALNFYNKHNGTDTTAKEGWHNFRFSSDAIKMLAQS